MRPIPTPAVAFLPALDWTVIVIYMLSMLAIGWYYNRKSETTEDYLLGGRQMKPAWVGISLFASLFSALSYLMLPGETISHGPTYVIGAMLAYPVVALVAGWIVIPLVMRQKATTAYEMLEERFGLTTRLVGSTFFLLIRLLWMALILHATSDQVLGPLLGLSDTATPYVSAALGLITVAYTSMGGLRAVVVTDTAQSFVLLGGAVLTLVFVHTRLESTDVPWQLQWQESWPELHWGLSSNSKVRTVAASFMVTLVWYICTTGSDQIAIQRYLATKDVRAARRMLFASLLVNGIAFLLLTLVGYALLSLFLVEPHTFGDGSITLAEADQLFPRFVAHGLPTGCSGLVIAGMMAAAMSSLSSGLSASSAVIAVDFFDRLRPNPQREIAYVRLARVISVVLGITVVLLSLGITMVEGNLLEMTVKISDLLVAPLFGLFFMAMFVPWANSRGTLVGAAFGIITVVAVSYWDDLFRDMTGLQGIDILWSMPLSLLVQIVAGSLASLLFIQRPN